MPGASDQTQLVKVLAQADTVMARDPEDGGTLIVANIIGQMPWTLPQEDS
jgi:hypothetical protein